MSDNRITRWVITRNDPQYGRMLAEDKQVRCTYDTKEDAEKMLACIEAECNEDTFRVVFRDARVLPCECYAHGDPVSWFFPNHEN